MQLKPADILEHLTAALVIILKEVVPGVGMVIDYKERIEAAQQMRSIFNKFDDVEQRMAALEGLATMPAAEVERIASRELHGSAEQNAYVLDVVQHITRQVTRKINSTRRLGAPRLQDDENFYLDLIPTQRPHDYRGQAVPQHPRWILQELIGSGGFGEVWRAQHETLPEQEAIKFCHEEAQREFLQREVNTLKLVQERLAQHPNIVRLKDVNLTQAPYWLAFEYIAGGTLLDVMQQRHLAWGEALHVMTGIVQGVAAAHALGIVHRDLKPANILLTPDGVPKVTDFGLGKVLQQSSSTTNLRMGTQHYASPEQINGSRTDPADDVYALGVIFWQLATHTLDGPQYFNHSLEHSRLPQLAKQLLADCLRPRGERPANAQALLQRLQQLPLTLATDAGLNELRQQADQARNAAQQAQAQQFAAQLQAQEQQAQQLRREQEARMQQFVPTPPAAAVPDGKLAAQWSALQKLVTAAQTTATTFDQELNQERQRIAEKLQQALDKLGLFRSEPRDEEFEYQQEYDKRIASKKAQYAEQVQAIKNLWERTKEENLARIESAKQAALAENRQAQAKFQAQRYAFQCSNLTDWRYDLDAGKLQCQGVIKQLLPTEQLRLNFAIAMPREQGRLYRSKPERFQISGQLALQAEPLAIVVAEAQLELVGEGRFTAQANVTIEVDEEAITWQKAFAQAQQIGTEAGFEEFIRNYPKAIQIHNAKQRLQELRWQEQQQRLMRFLSIAIPIAVVIMCCLIFTISYYDVIIKTADQSYDYVIKTTIQSYDAMIKTSIHLYSIITQSIYWGIACGLLIGIIGVIIGVIVVKIDNYRSGVATALIIAIIGVILGAVFWNDACDVFFTGVNILLDIIKGIIGMIFIILIIGGKMARG